MRILVIGLGSMGKRRVRNLLEVGGQDIYGYDIREDRCIEANTKYGIPCHADFNQAVSDAEPDALVISTSPDQHMRFAEWAFDNDKHAFIEASVTHADKIDELAQRLAAKKNLVIVPSCTMRFFPGPQKIKDLLEKRAVGKILYITYHTGQYLPDWHPWEDIKDYYVSKRETGAAREIIPFELTWLDDLFGHPEVISGFKAKISDIDADIDDLYQALLKYPDGVIMNLCVEVISRPVALREMIIIGEKGSIKFSGEKNAVQVESIGQDESEIYSFSSGSIEEGYINPEEPYIAEMSEYVHACMSRDPGLYRNNLKFDYEVLSVLNSIEKGTPNRG